MNISDCKRVTHRAGLLRAHVRQRKNKNNKVAIFIFYFMMRPEIINNNYQISTDLPREGAQYHIFIFLSKYRRKTTCFSIPESFFIFHPLKGKLVDAGTLSRK